MNTRQINIKRPTCATQAQKRFVGAPVTDWFMWFACKRKEEKWKQEKECTGLLFKWCHGDRSLSAIILRVSEFTNSSWWKHPRWFFDGSHIDFTVFSHPNLREGRAWMLEHFWGKHYPLWLEAGLFLPLQTANRGQKRETPSSLIAYVHLEKTKNIYSTSLIKTLEQNENQGLSECLRHPLKLGQWVYILKNSKT